MAAAPAERQGMNFLSQRERELFCSIPSGSSFIIRVVVVVIRGVVVPRLLLAWPPLVFLHKS